MNRFYYCLFIVMLVFTSCQQSLQYPKDFPETANVSSYTNSDSITTRYYFDSAGNIFRIANFDKNDKLCTMPESGVAESITIKKDNVTTTIYFDTNQKPVIHKEIGCACEVRKFNKNDFVLEEAYYDTHNKLVNIQGYESGEPYAMKRYEYDSNNNMTKIITYGADSKIMLPIIAYEYKIEYMITKTAFLDEKGKPMLGPNGYAYIESTINGNEITGYSIHGANGELIMGMNPDYYYEDSEGNQDLTLHARAEIAPSSDENGMLKVSLFDTQGKLIKETRTFDEVMDGGEDPYYVSVADTTFSNTEIIGLASRFVTQSTLKMKAEGNAFKMLQGWSYFLYYKMNGFDPQTDSNYEQADWKTSTDGKSNSKDESHESFIKGAWYTYYITDYIYANPTKIQTIFNSLKPLIQKSVSKDLYRSSGCDLLVSTALKAYDDIQQKGETATLQNIQTVMNRSSATNYYQTADLYEPMKGYMSMTSNDINAKVTEEEKREIVVWAYSFWLRRSLDKTIATSHNILVDIQTLYK